MDNLLEKKFHDFFKNEEKRMNDLFNSCRELLNDKSFSEINNLIENSFKKLVSKIDFLNNKEEVKEEEDKKPESEITRINKIISQTEGRERQKKAKLAKIDNFCRRVVKAINRDNIWSHEEKALAIIAIKLNILVAVFFGIEKANEFLYGTLSSDPNFKQIVGNENNRKRLEEYYTSAFAPLRDEFYGLKNPIFENNTCVINSSQRIRSTDSYTSTIVVKGDTFTLRVDNTKHGSPFDGVAVELQGLERGAPIDIFSRSMNITPSTKLLDMINFVNQERSTIDDL